MGNVGDIFSDFCGGYNDMPDETSIENFPSNQLNEYVVKYTAYKDSTSKKHIENT